MAPGGAGANQQVPLREKSPATVLEACAYRAWNRHVQHRSKNNSYAKVSNCFLGTRSQVVPSKERSDYPKGGSLNSVDRAQDLGGRRPMFAS